MVQTDLFAESAASHDTKRTSDIFIVNRRMLSSCELIFAWIFHRPLRRYWDNLNGFDIVKFDDDFFGSIGVLEDNIDRRYGKHAVALVELLISRPEVMLAWLASREANLDPKQLFRGLANRDLTFKP